LRISVGRQCHIGNPNSFPKRKIEDMQTWSVS
jgi:hypothetical protein